MKSFLALLFTACVVNGMAQPVIGSFACADVTSGSVVSLDKYSGSPALVVLFTSNECPFDNYYTDRIATLVSRYANQVPVLLVNSHLDPMESEENMKKEAAGWSFRAPYLADKNQTAMEMLGAKRSPEAFLLKPSDKGFQVVYSGALDDSPQIPGAVSVQYLRDAIESLLGGKPLPASVRAAGCSIRKK